MLDRKFTAGRDDGRDTAPDHHPPSPSRLTSLHDEGVRSPGLVVTAPGCASIPGQASSASVEPVATILLAGVDLFFRSKLEGLLPEHHFVTVNSVDPPDLVIADISRVEPEDVADEWPDVPIMGFTNHTDRTGLQRAHTAGFDQVIVKSALVERAPELVAELTRVT